MTPTADRAEVKVSGERAGECSCSQQLLSHEQPANLAFNDLCVESSTVGTRHGFGGEGG